MSEPQPPLVPGRSCEGCTLCCKLTAIPELKKPAQRWCQHVDIGKGCTIYEDRPPVCRQFYCGWLIDERIGDDWRPRDIRMFVKFQSKRIVLFVDKDRRDAWRKEPYLSQLRAWARAALPYDGEVLVLDGSRTLRIFPDREIDVTAQHPMG